MKGILVLFIFLLALLISVPAFAQIAKIVDIKGDVLVKETPAIDWARAKLNMLLNKDAEIKTEQNSECTLAFDEQLKNVLTLKEKSHIKIENIVPAKISLPEGRVFSIIKDLAKVEKFEIKTPTATAGARGSGMSIGSEEKSTSVMCFEHAAYVIGMDSAGNPTGEKDISSGYGLNVEEGGVLGDVFELTNRDYEQWNSFVDNVDAVSRENAQQSREGKAEGAAGEAEDTAAEENFDVGGLGDLIQESKDDYRQGVSEQRRQADEASIISHGCVGNCQ